MQTENSKDGVDAEDVTATSGAVANSTSATAGSVEGTQTKRTKLSKTLPTDRLVFTKQQEIIRAYGAAKEKYGSAVTIEQVTEFVPMAPATISQVNPFLTETGIIIKEGRKFRPSVELESLFQMYPISPQRAWAKLAPLMEKAWFGQVLIPKLKFRHMEYEDAVHDLAEAATAEKDHLPQLRLIIEYLALAGLVHRDGNHLRLVNNPRENGSAAGEASPAESEKSLAPAAADAHEPGLERYSLTLDPSSKRKIVLFAPPEISGAELKRIQQWLSFQLIISDQNGG